MARCRSAAAILTGFALLVGCNNGPSEDALPVRSDSAVCRKALEAILLELPRDGSYRLNQNVLTRNELEVSLASQLEKHSTGEPQTVLVELDSARRGELKWIVKVANEFGAEVIAPEFPCPSEVKLPN